MYTLPCWGIALASFRNTCECGTMVTKFLYGVEGVPVYKHNSWKVNVAIMFSVRLDLYFSCHFESL